MKYLIKVRDRYYYNRRVPEELRDYDPRDLIRVSLKTDSREHAWRKAVIFNEQVESYWQSLMGERQQHEQSRFRKAMRIASQMGFSYQPMSVVAALPLWELVERVLAVQGGTPTQIEAVLGGKPVPEIKLSGTLPRFWELTKDRIMNKSAGQVRKWKNPRMKAIRNFITVIGDKDLKTITREDVLAFRDWWLRRIDKENKKPGTSNKEFIFVKNIIETVSDNLHLELDIKYLFKKIILKVRHQQTRLPFTSQEIINILESEKLERLNIEARWFLHAAAETGARPAEIVGLLPEDIRLDAAVPHIVITDRKERTLKTPQSERKIPLVGYSLEAFINMPGGFPRYRDKADNLTNTVNKFLRENKLLPSRQHSVYSLRHSFQDRILSIDTPDRVQAELMGHKFNRPAYGNGPTLEHKLAVLNKICLKNELKISEILET